MMYTALVLSLLLGAALGQKCTRATTPIIWSGDFYESSYNFEGGGGFNIAHYRRGVRINYDATGEGKYHIREFIVKGTPFPDGRNREYQNERLVVYASSTMFEDIYFEGRCTKVRQYNRKFKALAVPDEAEYRGNTYIGGGRPLFKEGVEVEIYSTPRDEDDPDAPHYYGTWAPLDADYCIPVIEAFYQAFGRFGTEDVYTGHVTFYNITRRVDPTAFKAHPACDF